MGTVKNSMHWTLPNMWNLLPMNNHIYKDPVPTSVRQILARSFIMFFKTIMYQQHPVTQLYGAEFPKHHKQMLLDCIGIVESECQHYITSMQRYGSDVQLLKKTLSTITTGKLARLILDCTDTIRAKKNWNSYGATVREAICELSLINSSLHQASTTELSGYHADTPITIKAEPSIWPTAAFINIHEHPL